MAAINRAINITFKGKPYSIKMTMATIDAIEDKMNIVSFIQRLSSGDVRLSHAAKLFSIVLNEAGAETTQEEVYNEMFAGGDNSAHAVVEACGYIVSTIFPDNGEEEVESDKKKPLKRTNGRKSTKQ